ncbi:hypothetical protein [Lysobacter xanthus]
MSASPASPPGGIALQRRLVEAGLFACVAGLLVHRTWQALPAARFGESLALAALWAGLAALLARLRPLRMAEATAWIGALALVVMAGPGPVLASLLVVAAAIALGRLLVADTAIAFVVGAGLIAGAVGWVLPWPVHRRAVYVPLLLLVVVARRRDVAASFADALARTRASIDAAPRAAALGLLAVGLASTGAWLPTLQYDDLAGHLALPWQLMRNGRYAIDATHQVWALAPWAGDVLHGVVQVVAGAEARGPWNVAWLLACVALVHRIAGALGAPVALRWAAVLLVATLPPVIALVGGMQTELPATVAMLALLGLALAPQVPRSLPGIAVLAGFLAALKILHPVAALGALLFATVRARPWTAKAVATAALLLVLVGGSSYAWAAWRCGNPVLPLFNDVFRSPCFAPVAFADARWQSVPGLPRAWSMTFLTSKHLEGFDGGLGFALVALAGAAVVALLDRRTRVPMLCALVAIAVPMGVVAYARYVVPGVVLLVPVAVAAIARTLPQRRAMGLLLALALLDLAFQSNSQWMLHTGAVKRAVAAGGRDAPVVARYAPERLLLARVRERTPELVVLDLGGAAQAEMAGHGRTTLWYDPALHAGARAADRDATGAAWARLLRDERIGGVLLRAPDATPARRAGLARAGAHLAMTEGPVEFWALPTRPTE